MTIDSLLIDGIVSLDHTKIKEHMVEFYNSLFTKHFNWRPNLDGFSFESIGEVEVIWLERAFEEGEVFEGVKALNSDKTSGPDGFAMGFFKSCWDVLKEDIVNIFHEFHARGKIEKVLMLRSLLLL